MWWSEKDENRALNKKSKEAEKGVETRIERWGKSQQQQQQIVEKRQNGLEWTSTKVCKGERMNRKSRRRDKMS